MSLVETGARGRKAHGPHALMVPSLHRGLRSYSFDDRPRSRRQPITQPRERWSSKSRHRVGSTPVASGGLAYYSTAKSLIAVNALSGRRRWKAAIPGGWNVSTPLVAGGRVHVGTFRGSLVALDARTGKRLWETKTGPAVMHVLPYHRGSGSISSSPALSGPLLYVGADDGRLLAVDAKTGSIRWSHSFGVPVSSSPAVTGNAVFVAAMDGNLYAFAGR